MVQDTPDPKQHSTKASQPQLSADEAVQAAIQRVEGLYERITGHAAPALSGEPLAPIPPERDPQQFVEEQLDRLLDALSTGLPGQRGEDPPGLSAASWAPRADLVASELDLLVSVDLPGVRKEDLNVSLTGTTLVISGQRKLAFVGRRPVARAECPRGHFERRVELPPDALSSELEARLEHGVLEVRVPRVARSRQPRVVPVRAV
ncbi:MAG: Hsp20/alpha crystallin family protein [Planctomycetota bacterium]